MRYLAAALVLFLTACGKTPTQVLVHPNADVGKVVDAVQLLEDAAGCTLFKVRASSGTGRNWSRAWPTRGVVTVEVNPDKVGKQSEDFGAWTAYRYNVAKARVYLRPGSGPYLIAHELSAHALRLGHSDDCNSVLAHCESQGTKFTDEDIALLQGKCL